MNLTTARDSPHDVNLVPDSHLTAAQAEGHSTDSFPGGHLYLFGF